jgi:hypothetical protein
MAGYDRMAHAAVWMAHVGTATEARELLAVLWRLAFVGPALGFEPDPSLPTTEPCVACPALLKSKSA